MKPKTKKIVLEVLHEKREEEQSFIESKLRDLRYTQETVDNGRSQGARTIAASKVAAKQKCIKKLQADLAKLDAAIVELEAM
jgi:hypothetical protein